MGLWTVIKAIWGDSPNEWNWCPLAPSTMRRKVNGKWEYRPATEEEIEDYESTVAW